jgi:adsorption protein B
MANTTIYLIGLFAALCYVLFSIDDLLWDLAHVFRRKKTLPALKLDIRKLDELPPKLLAVMVAAWHEDAVLEPVVDNLLASVQYPRSMYHVFLGVYPNDEATIRAAERLQDKYDNVHMVVNTRPGPTCKADNLNSILSYIRQFELERRWRFASVTVHDSEDVVHPYELKVTNYLIDSYDALQFPVFPLQRMPSIKNFFSGLTTGTYADEFAENHYRTMSMRDAMAAIVPSAGTGFVLSRKILTAFGGKPLFPDDSLTEDYKLSLTFAMQGFKVHYVLEKVRRVTDNGRLKWDYIATRSIFPSTFKTAVRQKTRWIYGITMQSAQFSDIFASSRLSFAGRYSLYKDMKAKYSNLVTLPGYLIFLYAAASYLIDLPVMYPMYSLSWWLCVALTGLMVFRQLLRGAAIRHIYGFKSVVFACLLPPLMPIRLVWGNIINMAATLRAWKQYLFGIKSRKTSRKVAWSKTDHEFIEEAVLRGYRRKLGDILLEKGYIPPDTLSALLAIARSKTQRLGDILISHQAVTEEQLAQALAGTLNTVYLRSLEPFGSPPVTDDDWRYYWRTCHCPILKANGTVVVAATVDTPEAVLARIRISGGGIVYTTKHELLLFLTRRDHALPPLISDVAGQLAAGRLTWEQAVLALDNQAFSADILTTMGLSDPAEAASDLETAAV